MERRLLLVFALTFLVIMLFQPLLKKYGPQPAETKPQKQAETAPAQSAANQSAPGAAVSSALTHRPATLPPSGTKQAAIEAETTIENDLYRIRFSNHGGQVKSWILKKYDDDKGNPLELVNVAAAEKYGYPLSLWTYDESLRNKLNSALFVVSQEGMISAPAAMTFEYSDSDVSVRKTFQFDHTYVVKVETSVSYKGNEIPAMPMWPSGFGDEASPASYAAGRIDYQYNSKIERLAIKKISGGNTLQGPFNWAGVVNQYFAAIFIPDEPPNAAMVTLRNSIDVVGPGAARKPNSGGKRGGSETQSVQDLRDQSARDVRFMNGAKHDGRSCANDGAMSLCDVVVRHEVVQKHGGSLALAKLQATDIMEDTARARREPSLIRRPHATLLARQAANRASACGDAHGLVPHPRRSRASLRTRNHDICDPGHRSRRKRRQRRRRARPGGEPGDRICHRDASPRRQLSGARPFARRAVSHRRHRPDRQDERRPLDAS